MSVMEIARKALSQKLKSIEKPQVICIFNPAPSHPQIALSR